MEETIFYHRIAETIRKEILSGRYRSGDRLPSVRQLSEEWNCTSGTIQRAYNELVREGLLVSHRGQGTYVAGVIPQAVAQGNETLRRANLVNRMELALLEAITAGYDLAEIQQAVDLAMDRWRTLDATNEVKPENTLRFAGSHDLAMNDLVRFFPKRVVPGINFQITYYGSLGGLIALEEGKADLAGCHLWDAESQCYNIPFIRRLLPGKDFTVITLAHRRIGLIVSPGNPHQIQGFADLIRPGIRFVNRQAGSGTRVWFDEMLRKQAISPQAIQGYDDEVLTHTETARSVAEGRADVGLGLETAADAYGLDFIFLNRERYDIVCLTETARHPAVQRLIDWLGSKEGKGFIACHLGYDNQDTGKVIVSGNE